MVILRLILVAAVAGGAVLASAPAQTPELTTLDLATIRNIGRPSISPSGRYVVFQTYQADPQTNTYRNQWILADALTGTSRTIVPNGGEPILTYEDNETYVTDYEDDWASFLSAWPSDNMFYYVRRDNGVTAVHQMTLDGADRAVPGTTGTIIDFRQNGPAHATITTLAPTSATVAAARAARHSGFLFFGNTPSDDFDPWRGIPDTSPKTVPHYFDLDLATGTARVESSASSFDFFSDHPIKSIQNLLGAMYNTISPDGRKRAFVALMKNHGGVSFALYTTSPSGAEVSEIAPPPRSAPVEGDIESFAWSPDSRKIVYLRQDDYIYTDFYAVDVASRSVRRLTNLHALLDHCVYTPDTRYAACTIESALHPANIIRIDLTTGRSKILSDLNPRFDRLSQRFHTRTLVWKNTWGNPFFGELVYPRDYHPGMRYPVMVLTYGVYGFERGGSGDEYPILPLAEKGFFVLDVDLRGSLMYDTTTNAAGVLSVMHWQAPLDGMEAILRQLKAEGLINDEAGIGGLSYGSEMSSYTISHSKMFRAASESNGGSARDPMFYYLKDKRWDTTFKQWGLDGPPYGHNLANWERLSPALRASQVNAAMLMNAPDTDYLVGLQQYWELRDHRKPVELWVYPKEEHTKYQPTHRLTIYNLNVDWFRFWLQGYVDPDPAKAAQYRRWEALPKLQ